MRPPAEAGRTYVEDDTAPGNELLASEKSKITTVGSSGQGFTDDWVRGKA